MATATAASAISLGLNACFAARRVIPSPSVSFLSRKTPSALPLSLSSSAFTSGTRLVLLNRNFTRGAPNRRPLQVECVKCYKMKTHKASAKRFRVSGSGKIMRRRAGKQHLLRKKNAKRRLRLSKMVQVDRSDYNNVTGALPYLKVNRDK